MTDCLNAVTVTVATQGPQTTEGMPTSDRIEQSSSAFGWRWAMSPREGYGWPYPCRVYDVPRSVLLALWTTAFLERRVDIDRAVAAIQGADDERHQLTGEDLPFSAHPAGPGLADWLDWLGDARARAVRAVLPVPGDTLGIPGGPPVAAAVLDCGEGVVTVPDQPDGEYWALAGELIEFGTDLEPGSRVVWHQHRAGRVPVTPGTLIGPSEAEAALRRTLTTLTAQLTDLDVARWRDIAVDLRGKAGLDGRLLPQGTSPRVARTLEQALRVRSILAVAAEDEGASVNSWEVESRTRLLRDLDTVARHAIVAVTIPEG